MCRANGGAVTHEEELAATPAASPPAAVAKTKTTLQPCMYLHAYLIARNIATLMFLTTIYIDGAYSCRVTENSGGCTTRSKRGIRGGKRLNTTRK